MAIEPKQPEFRDDLRPPHVTFGRCALTGQWGKCVAIDLGSICLTAPDIEKGVLYDPETANVTFTVFKPVLFNNQLTLSEDGMRKLLAYTESQDNPIPSVTPELVYKWTVTYEDGSALAQFMCDDSGAEVENKSDIIDFGRVTQLNVVPRLVSEDELPTYSFARADGRFYKAGQEIDTGYDGAYLPGAEMIYCRRVVHTWGSGPGTGLDRTIEAVSTSVVQIMGWKIGGLQALIEGTPTPGCVICIDERGNWRPYDYVN